MEFEFNTIPFDNIPAFAEKYYGWKQIDDDWVVDYIKCTNCDSRITGLEYFCPWCGNPLLSTANPNPSQETGEEQDAIL